MKESHFFGDWWILMWFFGWDWGTPTILQQNSNKITVLYGCDFGFKKLGLGQTPATPSLGQNHNFDRKYLFNASLTQHGGFGVHWLLYKCPTEKYRRIQNRWLGVHWFLAPTIGSCSSRPTTMETAENMEQKNFTVTVFSSSKNSFLSQKLSPSHFFSSKNNPHHSFFSQKIITIMVSSSDWPRPRRLRI